MPINFLDLQTKILVTIVVTVSLLTLHLTFSSSEAQDELLAWNAPANRQNCPIGQSAVWAEHEDGAECIRYFFSSDIDEAPLVFVRMYGDRSVAMHQALAEIANNTKEEQQAIAERRAQELGLPVIILARPGTYGSSGDHGERRQKSEFLALNAALDEIMQKHQIEKFVLSGHSGGATAVGAMLTLGREDIACAIMTSGAFGLLERAQRLRERKGNPPRPGIDGTGLPTPYDPLEHISGVVDDPERTIVIIGNRDDINTPFDLQEKFKAALSDAGHQVTLIDHPAHGPSSHNLQGRIGYTAIEYCDIGSD